MLSFQLYFCCSVILAFVAQPKKCAQTSHWSETYRHGSVVILPLDKRLTPWWEQVCLHFLPVRNKHWSEGFERYSAPNKTYRDRRLNLLKRRHLLTFEICQSTTRKRKHRPSNTGECHLFSVWWNTLVHEQIRSNTHQLSRKSFPSVKKDDLLLVLSSRLTGGKPTVIPVCAENLCLVACN